METLINGDEDFMTNASTPRGKWRHALFFHITATLRSPLTRTVLLLTNLLIFNPFVLVNYLYSTLFFLLNYLFSTLVTYYFPLLSLVFLLVLFAVYDSFFFFSTFLRVFSSSSF